MSIELEMSVPDSHDWVCARCGEQAPQMEDYCPKCAQFLAKHHERWEPKLLQIIHELRDELENVRLEKRELQARIQMIEANQERGQELRRSLARLHKDEVACERPPMSELGKRIFDICNPETIQDDLRKAGVL